MTEAHLAHKVEHALLAVDHFSALLEQETDALQKSDYGTFQALQDKKLDLAQGYQNAVLAFEKDIDILQTMDAARKDALRQAHVRFTKAADANQETLKASGHVADRIVKLIMNAARDSVSDSPSYNASGYQGLSDKLPVHFKLNETL